MNERDWELKSQWSETHKKIANDRSDRGNNTGNGFKSEIVTTIIPSSKSMLGRGLWGKPAPQDRSLEVLQ